MGILFIFVFFLYYGFQNGLSDFVHFIIFNFLEKILTFLKRKKKEKSKGMFVNQFLKLF